MKTKLLTLIAGLLAGWFSQQQLLARELKDLKVLYIGSERAGEFVPFLKKHVAQVDARKRSGFNATDAADFDVVPACSNRLPFRLVPATETCHKFSIAMKAIRDSDGRFGLRRQAQRDSAFRGGLRRGPVMRRRAPKDGLWWPVESLQSALSGQPRLIP